MVHMWVSRIDWVDNFTVLGKYIHTAKKRYCWAHEGYFHPHNRKWAIPNPQVGSGRGTGWPYFVKSPLAALWRPRDGSVWGLFRAREVTPAIWQCLGAVSCPRDDRPWGGTVCGCCFVPARWPTLRWHSVWVLFCSRQMTDPEVAQCVGAVLFPPDDRPWGGTVCGCCFVPARWPTLRWQLVGSTQCTWCDFWYHDNLPGALSIELTELQVINEVLLFVYAYTFVVSVITVHSYHVCRWSNTLGLYGRIRVNKPSGHITQ